MKICDEWGPRRGLASPSLTLPNLARKPGRAGTGPQGSPPGPDLRPKRIRARWSVEGPSRLGPHTLDRRAPVSIARAGPLLRGARNGPVPMGDCRKGQPAGSIVAWDRVFFVLVTRFAIRRGQRPETGNETRIPPFPPAITGCRRVCFHPTGTARSVWATIAETCALPAAPDRRPPPAIVPEVQQAPRPRPGLQEHTQNVFRVLGQWMRAPYKFSLPVDRAAAGFNRLSPVPIQKFSGNLRYPSWDNGTSGAA